MILRPTPMLLLVTCLLFFVGLGNHELQGSTEPRVAGIAMEMHLLDDWVTPRLNGQPFLEKPPLSLWLDAGALRTFGLTPWSVRLASALAGLLSVMLLYAMLRAWGRPAWLAAGAGLLLATSASFWGNVRQVGEDALLSLGVSLALLAFFHLYRPGSLGSRQRVLGWLAFASGIAIATTSKGVLGLALPGVVIFAWLLVASLRQRQLRPAQWLLPAAVTLLGLVPLLIWLVLLHRAGGMAAVSDVLWTNSVGRFSGSFSDAGHYEPFYYYLGKLPEAFLPWNLLVYLGLWHFRKQLGARPELLFFTLWLVAQFTLLTLASSKRMVYLLSLTPAAAVIGAEFAAVYLAQPRPRLRALALGLAGAVACAYLAIAVWVLPREDRQQTLLPLTARIAQLQAEGRSVVLFDPSERLAGAGVFYSRSLLKALADDSGLHTFLSASPDNVAVMEREQTPAEPLHVLDKIVVGGRTYYFVTYLVNGLVTK
ncbi:glycosyltransferase family 39 protein [Pseudomonas sp. HR96]|uniref:ArnT family glycosyltransferase n=1 Tax=Pseudomonas sp. HR96 TaxID=1027966 RepID=UPI002A75BD45|nr:phospholipid carrier-dependent glycosyltransferase [Pseudomonas sp. HR96]WPP01178.1 glycosyltransferase family 39 protein [Pseudomonas sp. HR96]